MRKQLLDILHDCAVVCLIGAALDAALFAVLFGVCWIAAGWNALAALGYVRSAMMVTGALALFVCAGLLLVRKGAGLRDHEHWNKLFRSFGLFPALLGLAVFVLALAVGLDYLLYVYTRTR